MKQALEMALDALESAEPKYTKQRADQKTLGGSLDYWKLSQDQRLKAITAIKEALAQPEQEPVSLPCCAYTDASAIKWNSYNQVVQCHNCGQIYTTPPQRKPLTDDELIECERLADIRHRKHMGSIRGQQLSPADQFLWHYARAIEAAHGIKE